MSAEIHFFSESLKREREVADAPFWLDVYHQAFPTLQSCVRTKLNSWAQRSGIDRILTLDCGRTIKIEEKYRDADYGDMAIERWSNLERRMDGWALKPLACDYLAYAIVPRRACYLFPFLDLQRAWQRHGANWAAKAKLRQGGFSIIKSRNDGYTTICLAVPFETLFAAMREAATFSWADEP